MRVGDWWSGRDGESIQGRKNGKCSLPEERTSWVYWRPMLSKLVQEKYVLLLLFVCLFNFEKSHFVDKV